MRGGCSRLVTSCARGSIRIKGQHSVVTHWRLYFPRVISYKYCYSRFTVPFPVLTHSIQRFFQSANPTLYIQVPTERTGRQGEKQYSKVPQDGQQIHPNAHKKWFITVIDSCFTAHVPGSARRPRNAFNPASPIKQRQPLPRTLQLSRVQILHWWR